MVLLLFLKNHCVRIKSSKFLLDVWLVSKKGKSCWLVTENDFALDNIKHQTFTK